MLLAGIWVLLCREKVWQIRYLGAAAIAKFILRLAVKNVHIEDTKLVRDESFIYE